MICPSCQIEVPCLQRDHIIPQFKFRSGEATGNPHAKSNIQRICATCHDLKTRRELQENPPVTIRKKKILKLKGSPEESYLTLEEFAKLYSVSTSSFKKYVMAHPDFPRPAFSVWHTRIVSRFMNKHLHELFKGKS